MTYRGPRTDGPKSSVISFWSAGYISMRLKALTTSHDVPALSVSKPPICGSLSSPSNFTPFLRHLRFSRFRLATKRRCLILSSALMAAQSAADTSFRVAFSTKNAGIIICPRATNSLES